MYLFMKFLEYGKCIALYHWVFSNWRFPGTVHLESSGNIFFLLLEYNKNVLPPGSWRIMTFPGKIPIFSEADICNANIFSKCIWIQLVCYLEYIFRRSCLNSVQLISSEDILKLPMRHNENIFIWYWMIHSWPYEMFLLKTLQMHIFV